MLNEGCVVRHHAPIAALARGGLAVSLTLMLGVSCNLGGLMARAAADVCPEPNERPEQACFLGPDSPADGYLDQVDDVDTYRLKVPPGNNLTAVLDPLPDDYGLVLRDAEGYVRGTALQTGLRRKELRVRGLSTGSYFLSIVVVSGDGSAQRPYTVGVKYPLSLLLDEPRPAEAPGGVRQPVHFIPRPARAYALQAADVGPSFRELQRTESQDGRRVQNQIVPPDATHSWLSSDLWVSHAVIWSAWSSVIVEPYESNALLSENFDQTVAERDERQQIRLVLAKSHIGQRNESLTCRDTAGRPADKRVRRSHGH
jgi:hypothetical protein